MLVDFSTAQLINFREIGSLINLILLYKERFKTENRKRNIQLKIWVSEEENRLIREKMKSLPTNSLGSYIRKMAIDGYIIVTDTSDIRKFSAELQRIGNNINQIAKRVNSTCSIYDEDIAKIEEGMKKIWQLQRHILLNLP